MYASGVTTVYNGGRYIIVTLKDSKQKAISGVRVTVKFSNGKTIFANTDTNGQIRVTTNGLTPVKTYKATITFAGNSKYAKSTKTVNVVVKKAIPKLYAAKKTYKLSVRTKAYTVTLKTNQNKVMKGVWVSLTVNKKTYKVKTNPRGQVTFKITNLMKKGTFTAVVRYAGGNYYTAKTVNTRIAVR